MAYVDNLVQGVALAERHPAAPGQAFWVADRDAYPLARWCHGAPGPRRGGLPHARRCAPGTGGAGAPAERADRVLQRRGRYVTQVHVLGELSKTIRCDISRTVEVLGYEPRVSLLEGMRRSIRWCASQGLDIAPRPSGQSAAPA